MPDTVEIAKMKVADLKRELKLRGLSITGNKTELAERLQAALIDGELSLEDSAICGEDLLDEDVVLTDEESKILDENELLKSPKTMEKQNLNDLLDEKSTTVTNSTTPGGKKVLLKRKISTSIISETSSTPTLTLSKENTAPTAAKQVKDGELIEGKPQAIELSEGSSPGVKKVTQLTPQERLEMRAKKFGLNTPTNNVAAAADTPTKSSNAPMKVIDAGNAEKEAELLKKRAERFGCVVSSKMVQLDAEERLQKRKERFGATATAKATVLSPAPAATAATNDVWAEKARLRLERFKVNNTADNQKAINT